MRSALRSSSPAQHFLAILPHHWKGVCAREQIPMRKRLLAAAIPTSCKPHSQADQPGNGCASSSVSVGSPIMVKTLPAGGRPETACGKSSSLIFLFITSRRRCVPASEQGRPLSDTHQIEVISSEESSRRSKQIPFLAFGSSAASSSMCHLPVELTSFLRTGLAILRQCSLLNSGREEDNAGLTKTQPRVATVQSSDGVLPRVVKSGDGAPCPNQPPGPLNSRGQSGAKRHRFPCTVFIRISCKRKVHIPRTACIFAVFPPGQPRIPLQLTQNFRQRFFHITDNKKIKNPPAVQG